MKVASGVHATATDPENGKAEVYALRKELQRYWDINDVDYLTVSEIAVKRSDRGRFLSYDYEAREHLFRSEEHTSELQSLMRISYAVFCLKKTKKITNDTINSVKETTTT